MYPELTANSYYFQGCVITRSRKDVDLWSMNDHTNPSMSWYLVQTNYDHWKKPPHMDNRRVPAMICLELLGRENATYTLYNVMSTMPVLNKVGIVELMGI